MDDCTGKLVEISPWGTGFIKDAFGQFFGFHYSMLAHRYEMPDEGSLPELENKPVIFTVNDGIVSNVALQVSAFAGPLAAGAGHAKAAV